MVRGNLTLIPEEWKCPCAYLCVKGMFARKEYDSAYAAASMLLNFDKRKDVLLAFPVYERLVCGLSCHELGHREEAFSWFRQTAEMCCFTGEALTMDLSPREFYRAERDLKVISNMEYVFKPYRKVVFSKRYIFLFHMER